MTVYGSRTIGLVELASLIRKENLGEPHTVLAGGERYFSARFGGPDGLRPDDELLDLVALMQRARVEHYAWISAEHGPSAALVAAAGRAAVLVTREGDQVTLAGMDPDRLVGELVRQLPEVPAGRGESISIRTADYAPPQADADGFLQQAPAERPQEALRLDQLLEAPRIGGAKLYTAKRDSGGTRRRAQDWLTVLDLTRQGRWVVYTRAGRGERAINALPGTPQVLATKLTELHALLN